MSFTLRVQFTGLCLHVKHPERPEVAVLMPDARYGSEPSDLHCDGTPSVPHIGYLRADLANVLPAGGGTVIPDGQERLDEERNDNPFFEVVYRFDNQTLDFGLTPTGAPVTFGPSLPDFARVESAARLRSDLFSGSVQSPLLFRTVLHGGALTPPFLPEVYLDRWAIDWRAVSADAGVVVGPFPGDVIWTREVEDRDDLTLTITRFDGTGAVEVPLRPIGPTTNRVIALKIANLCATNPLEWDRFEIHAVEGEDSDFKCLYDLFEPSQPPDSAEPLDDSGCRSAWPQMVGRSLLPAPRLVKRAKGEGLGGGAGDCIGGQTIAAFPRFEAWPSK